MSRVAVVGVGYAGLGTAIVLAKKGNSVTCVDLDREKLDLISRGKSPVFESGFEREIGKLIPRRMKVSQDVPESVRGSDIIFLCVGTPSREDGSLDPSQVESASKSIGEGLRQRPRQLVVVKSTVVPGTTESSVIPVLEGASGLHAGEFGVCVSPEFIREGQALADSLRPSRIVIGELDRASGNVLARLYSSFHCPKIRTSLRVAEAIKYAANAFLAMKVTFANEIANLCTRLGLDSDEVLRGIVLDPRVGPGHLQPGVGFGGSCLPKDLRALVGVSRRSGYEPLLLESVQRTNDRQHLEVVRLLEEEIGPVATKRIALLGLAFKPGTDDVRESKATAIATELIGRGAHVVGYDPRASENFSRAVHGVDLVRSAIDALRGADGCIIQAPWPEISRLKARDFATMGTPVVIDGRRTWPRTKVPEGIRYRRIG